MLIHIVIAVGEAELRRRFQQLLAQPDVVVNAVQDVVRLWETVSRESFDIAIIGRALMSAPAVEMVTSLRTLPDSPEVVVLCEREDAAERAALLGAGCLAILHTGLSDAVLKTSLSAMIQRRLAQESKSLLAGPEPVLGRG